MVHDLPHALRAHGFVFLPRWAPTKSTLELAQSVGIIAALANVNEVQTLAPRDAAPVGSYSGNFGVQEFPLHTDLAHWATPPRFLILRCLVGDLGVETTLFDSARLAHEFDAAALRRVLWLPRRPVGLHRTLYRMLDAPGGTQRFRWDRLFLRPATPESSRVVDSVDAFARRVRLQALALVNVGDTIILDNWRVLHGRSGVPPAAHGRRIQRVYLEELSQ